jgi:DNA-binding Lrp family transcriptional regulator
MVNNYYGYINKQDVNIIFDKMSKRKGKINRNEKIILKMLRENARQSFIEISEKTGLSRQTVQKTISRLEKNKTIWGHYSVVDLEKIGKKRFIMLIKVKPNVTKEKTLDGISKVRKMVSKGKSTEFLYSGYYHGLYDWIIIFAAEDIVQAKKILLQWQNLFSDLIKDIHLLEELLPTRVGAFVNPNIEQEMDKVL